MRGVKQFLKNNTVIICCTIIVLWAISAATILVVTGNYMSLRSLIALLSPAISSIAVLLGVNVRLKEAKDQVTAVSDKISKGDATDTGP